MNWSNWRVNHWKPQKLDRDERDIFVKSQPIESMTYYYGIYSSSHRGKEERENTDGQGLEAKEAIGPGRASWTWSRLIHRIFKACP